MYFYKISGAALLLYGAYAVKAVENFDILVTQIVSIAVDKAVVPSLHGIVFDAVAAHDIHLHTVVGHEIVTAASGYFAGGIVEQIVLIKNKKFSRREIVIKKTGTDVNGRRKIQPVVPEVNQAHPFGEGERSVLGIVFQTDGGVALRAAVAVR